MVIRHNRLWPRMYLKSHVGEPAYISAQVQVGCGSAADERHAHMTMQLMS